MLIQVKVWFQNRRMKWRHSKEAKHQQTSTSSSESRCVREEQGGPDSTQEPEIDIQTVDSWKWERIITEMMVKLLWLENKKEQLV